MYHSALANDYSSARCERRVAPTERDTRRFHRHGEGAEGVVDVSGGCVR